MNPETRQRIAEFWDCLYHHGPLGLKCPQSVEFDVILHPDSWYSWRPMVDTGKDVDFLSVQAGPFSVVLWR